MLRILWGYTLDQHPTGLRQVEKGSIASGGCSASVDRLVVNADVSTNAEEEQGDFLKLLGPGVTSYRTRAGRDYDYRAVK